MHTSGIPALNVRPSTVILQTVNLSVFGSTIFAWTPLGWTHLERGPDASAMTSTVTLVILRDLVPREEDAPLPEKPGAPLSPPSEAMALSLITHLTLPTIYSV